MNSTRLALKEARVQLGWAWSDTGSGMDPNISGSTTYGEAGTNLLLQLRASLQIEEAHAIKAPDWRPGFEQVGIYRPFLPHGWPVQGNPGAWAPSVASTDSAVDPCIACSVL
jgi:hypothetical protein